MPIWFEELSVGDGIWVGGAMGEAFEGSVRRRRSKDDAKRR